MNELDTPVPAFEDNYIWLVSDGRDAIAVDPGEAAPVRRVLAERGWRLTAILHPPSRRPCRRCRRPAR
jgi:hydroxyacylglutathione hydrolase